MVSARRAAFPLRFSFSGCARYPDRHAGVSPRDFRGSQGHPDLPHRRHFDGAVQDGGRLVDLSRSRILSCWRRNAVFRIHVCLNGSYIARAWRLVQVRFVRHPPLWALFVVSVGIYVNFYSHHYFADIRLVLFAALALLCGRTWFYYKVHHRYRRMPLLLGLFLVAVFIWIAENFGTLTRTWIYPSQINGWAMVPLGKLSSWFLLMTISYVMVAWVNRPQDYAGEP